MNEYLASSHTIDWQHSAVLAKAKQLAAHKSSSEEVTRHCFEFVRDEIRHSLDYNLNPVTCKASEVLAHQTGYCYAKSHLLAALLRANNIPAGLCYQRLATGDDQQPFCLHGLNAVYLAEYGWYRIDPRGNKPGITADFCPPVEKLAFSTEGNGEADLPEVWASPLPNVIAALQNNNDVQKVANNLPDILMP